LMPMDIQDYYSSYCKEYLTLLPDMHWRHLRIVDWHDKFHKVVDVIRTVDQLQRLLAETTPKHVYVSTGLFLNPANMGPRMDADYSCIFLAHNLVFDIDRESLSEAKREALKLIRFLEDLGHENLEVVWTGRRGFQIWDLSYQPTVEISDPWNRENAYIKEADRIFKQVEAKGIKVDPSVTVNTRCIVRLAGTIHGLTGLPAIHVDRDKLDNFDIQGLPKIQCPTIRKAEMTQPSHAIERQAASTPSWTRGLPETLIEVAFTNRVQETRSYVLFLEHSCLKEAVREADRLQREEGLADLYHFKCTDKIYSICPQIMDTDQLDKILRKTDNPMLKPFRKYGQSIIPITKIGRNGLPDALQYLQATISPQANLRNKHFSKAHVNWLRNFSQTASLEASSGIEQVEILKIARRLQK